MRTKLIYSALALLMTISSMAQVNGIWEDIGPFDFPPHENWQIAGVARISQMKFHPTDPKTLYAVNSMGGLFISNDGGENWRTTGIDKLPATRCASVCIDHTDPNVMYFGTGDPSYYSNGLGIWKSTNGGYNFTRKSNGIDNRLPVEILMDPNDRNTLIAATRDGIWKTTNGGDNWNEVKANGDFTDMVYKPGSNDVLYATTKSEFWKSTNGGNNWSRINLPGNGISGGGRIAVSKANSNVVYLTYVGNFEGGSTTPVLKSDNSGDSFYTVKNPGGINLNGYDENSRGQGNYNYALSCDPNNVNHLFACGHIMWESTNGGSTWVKISESWATQVHTDMRQMPFSPFIANEVYNINDGGIWKSTNGGKSFLPICDGLTGTESYVGCQSPVKKEAISIGAQDNGEFIYKDGIWYNNAGGDVHRAMVHDNISADYYYDLSNNDNYKGRRRYLPTGAQINLEMPFTADGNGQDMRTDFPLTNTNVGYFAYNDVYRANNLSNNPPTWTKISNFNRRVKALASSPNDANVLYVITDNGQIHRTDNALAGSPNYASYNLPNNTNVTASIAVAKSNANIVYVVCNSKVYRSDNRGANWSDVTGSLPGVNYHTILHDIYSTNEAMYLAGYTTVWYKDNTMNDWMNYSAGLPSVVNFRKIYMYNDGTANSVLTAITGGRSVFRAGLNNKHILRKAENPEDIIPGLVYSYFEKDDLKSLPLFSALTPNKTGNTATITSSVKQREENYAIQFQGYIDIPEDGKYTFYLSSDDGSQMFIGEDLVINNDGIHGTVEQNGYAWLEKGRHVFTVNYFQGLGGQDLGFSWEGPSFGKRTVPSNVFYQLSPESICPENGKISVERWNNVNGNTVANIPVNNNPSQTWEATLFESEPTDGDNYGVRYRGFICPPYTGNYIFYVSSDDASEVWVSTDDKPANKQRVCYLNGSVELRNWYKYPTQKSDNVYLEAGKQYYVEALHKEGNGGDNFAVAWTTPSGEFQAPIEGKHLSPYTNNNAPTVSLTAPANNSLVEYGSNVTITANASDDGNVTKVEFYVNDVLIGSDNTNPYQITWNPDLNGTHKIHARAIDNSGRVTTTTKNSITTYTLRDPENPQFSVNGLDYSYYEGSWTSLPNFNNLFTLAQGTTNTIDLSKALRDESYGLVFNGFIEIPTDGFYTFYLDGDDGVQLLVGETPVITYDGIHGMGHGVREGGIGLKAGKHAITFNYFQGTGGKGISLQYEGPSITKQNISDNKWFRQTFENAHPTVSLTGNSNSTVEPATINLEATANDADGTIDHVNFYVDNVFSGEETQAPYTETISNLSAGTYTFTAIAYDNLGDSTISNNVVMVIEPENVAPTVSITNPIQGETFTGTSNVSIEVEANDSDGTIQRVEYYNGAILIATIENALFNYLWEDVVEGNYDITVKAFDDDDAVTTSETISIEVELLTGDLYSAFEENSNILNIYPNPALTNTKATITLNEGGNGILQIVDMRGQVHFSNESLPLNSGINHVDLDATNLSAGQYLLTLQLNGNKYISKLMCGQKPKKDKQ